MATEIHTTETLSTMKTVELRKFAASAFGIQKLDRDGNEISVHHGRKDELIANILRQQEFNATYVSAEGRRNANFHPVYGWPIAGEQPTTDKAVRTEDGTVKGKLCAECGTNKIDKRTQGSDSTMCRVCFDLAGLENEHVDGFHDDAPVAGCPNCPKDSPAAEISAKALRFEADARKAGWSALARNAADGSGHSLVTATSPDGRTLELHWYGKVYVYNESAYVQTGNRPVKVRNASAARKLLSDA